MKMSINGNSIVGPIEGVDCVLAAIRDKFISKREIVRIVYTFVYYPGVGYIWIPRGFLQEPDLQHVSVNIVGDEIRASLLDYRLQTGGYAGFPSIDHDEFSPVGYLGVKNNYLHVVADKPSGAVSAKDLTQGKFFSGQWYTPTYNGAILKINTLRALANNSGTQNSLVFRDYSHTETEVVDAKITFVPYSDQISLWKATTDNNLYNNLDANCSFIPDKTIAMKYFDSWCETDQDYYQENCTGLLGSTSVNCLFIGSLDVPGEHGSFEKVEDKAILCNRGYGYRVSDTCGKDTLGNCGVDEKCIRVGGGDGFACDLQAEAPEFTPPTDTLQDSRHSPFGKLWFWTIIFVVVLLFMLGIFAKLSYKV